MPRNGKRKRNSSRQHSAPQVPPQSLVDLINSDAAVLEYFTHLQTCLAEDVKKWKDRAKKYKAECQELTTRLLEQPQPSLPPPRSSSQPTRKRKTKASQFLESLQDETETDLIVRGETTSPTRASANNGKRPAVTSRAGEESVFSLPSSDDEIESVVLPKLRMEQEEEEDTTDHTVYGLLLEAFNNFRELGVALVVVEEAIIDDTAAVLDDSNSRNEQSSSDSETENRKAETKLIRRSDHDVTADLMHAFHSLTRIQTQMKESTMYPPFSADADFIPCCRVESHPASKGKNCALQALLVMDVYCTSMTDGQWNKLFPPGVADEAVRVGMRDRHHLVDSLVASLSGEISDAWAVADRSSRLINTSTHFEASAVDDEVAHFVGYFGAKSHVRLSDLAEKCLLAEVLTTILYERGECQDILELLVRYVVSSSPSIGVEDYPRLPPVLSLCVFESLLLSANSGLSSLLDLYPSGKSDNSQSIHILRPIALAMHTTVLLFKHRLASSDDRISDVSRVELSCFGRLSKTHPAWIYYPACEESLDACCNEASLLLEYATSYSTQCEMQMTASKTFGACLALRIALIILGETNVLVATFEKSLTNIQRDSFWFPVACCSAFRQLQVRQIDSLREKQASLMGASLLTSPSFSDQMTGRFDKFLGPNSKPLESVVDMIVKCCMQLSVAEYMHKVLLWLASAEWPPSGRPRYSMAILSCLGTPLAQMRSPVVRVINLERRCDRMKAFMAQAQSEGILVSKAVARLDEDKEQCQTIPSSFCDVDTHPFWGMYAFDGQGGMLEVKSRVSKRIGDTLKLSDFVDSQWRPNDLKAFDKDARNDEALVQLSPSECACALSHIASWKGVCRSLNATPDSQDDTDSLLPFPFMISGYARGEPVLHSNEQMALTPVCVVLEDDAILVDRFADRLTALLEELPRDFHFCSIGYSRPKTAPIAKYSSQLGIPSCIWYMTGYILSLEGAKHLLDSLPVQGPVDSWIGLKMCANWDNVFGQAMGVGARSSASAELPPRKDLARILKFRAFAALIPLCSQKVDTSPTNTTVGRSWRQRDTDVTYSGNL